MTDHDTLAPLGGVSVRAAAWGSATASTRLAEVGVAGALAAVLMVLVWLGLRPDLASAASHVFFWIKGLYTVGLSWAALSATQAIARPQGARRSGIAAALVLIFAMLIAAGVQLKHLDPAVLAAQFLPVCIGPCLLKIAGLALPMLVFALAGLSPLDLERPALTGLAVGLFCGGVAATVYGLHCPQSTFVFVGFWYTTAIGLCGALGAVALKLLSLRNSPTPP